MRSKLVHLFFGLCVFVGLVGAQDSIDDLFNDPELGIVEEQPEDPIDPDELTPQQDARFSGSVSAEAGVVAGLIDWTWPIELNDDISVTPFYSMDTTLKLDVRPTNTTRFYATLGAGVPEGGSLVFDTIDIGELFLDYTFADTVFFRVGKQSLTWGNGQIFNPANLASDVSNSTSIKASFPLGPLSSTIVAIARDSYFGDPELPGIAEVGIAGQTETSISPVSLGVSSFYQASRGLRTAAYLKSVLLGIDLLAEGTASWDAHFDSAEWAALGSLFWEGTDIGLVLVGEYLFESTNLPEGLGSTIGIGMAATDLLRDGWNPGVQWRHALYDSSGEVVIGLDGTLGNNLDVSFGVPIVYGADGTTYRGDGSDPESRVIAGVVRFSLSVGF